MQTLLKNTQAYRLLQKEEKTGDFSHAYLLLFNDARNLRLALKTFAKPFFSCADADTPQKKRISQLIDEENFADCLLYPQEGKKLSVDDAERIQEEATLQPVEGERKLFLISDFAEANVQTQNKLLKLLEEPPKGVTLLLGATVSFPVLPTILSRTEKLEILPFSTLDVLAALKRLYPQKEERELSAIACTANGSVGDGQNMLDGGAYKSIMDAAFSLALCSSSQLPATVKQLGETKRQKELISTLRLIFRDALVQKTLEKGKAEKALLLYLEKERVQEVSEKYSAEALLYAQEAFSEAEKQIKFNAVFPQCIELCMANIARKNVK